MATVIDGVYILKKKIGKGGMAAVYLAEVDLGRFDYTTLYAYTQVQGESHAERRRKAEELAEDLKEKDLDLATMRVVLETQNIPIPGEQVAIKVATGQIDLPRFEGEWKNLLCLNHENVVKVYGGGIYQKRPYYAMEFLENLVSPSRLKKEFSIRQKIDVLIQAGRGLQYLHSNGLIHRDIKPDNMVTCEVEPGLFVTKVTDLGLGKNLDENMGLTQSNTVMGSPSYMSPEQIASTRDVDFRADIYSLGASLYEFATGSRPYHNKTTVYELIASVSQGEKPIPVKEHAPQIPDALVGIIETAMDFDPANRYASVKEMTGDLHLYLDEEVQDITGSSAFEANAPTISTAGSDQGKYAFEKRKAAKKKKAARKKASVRKKASRAKQTQKQSPTRQRTSSHRPAWLPYALVGGGTAAIAVALLLLSLLGGDSKPASSEAEPPTESPRASPTAQEAPQAESESVATQKKATPPESSNALSPDRVRTLLRKAAPKIKDAKVYEHWPFDEAEAKRRQQETAEFLNLPIELAVRLPNEEILPFALVPAGTFKIGTPEEEVKALMKRHENDAWFLKYAPTEIPQHRVRITRPFYMGKTEVTQAQWEAIAGNNPSNHSGSPALPVEQIPRFDIKWKFFDQLPESFRFDPLARLALPTEAQWEYACRAGAATAFSSGDDEDALKRVAWYRGNSDKQTHPVAQKKPNAWGIHDMHGNVLEYVRDKYDKDWYEEAASRTNPLNPPEQPRKDFIPEGLARGGCFFNPSYLVRASLRGEPIHFSSAAPHRGFRLCLEIGPSGE